jgi:acyl carrier protein
MEKHMEEQLRDIIAKIAETSPDFGADADLRDEVGVDSHRAVELLFELERVFDVKIPSTKFDQMRTLRQTLSLVQSLKSGA